MESFFVNILIPLTYVLILIALVAAVGLSIFNSLKDPKGAKKGLAGLGVLVVILLISYFTASGDFTFNGIEKFEISESGIKLVGAGINATFILLVVGVVSLVASEVMSAFK